MYFEEDLNQNPDNASKAQEENAEPETETGKKSEKKSTKKVALKKQISLKEKKEIKAGLQDKTSEKPVKKAKVKKASPARQIEESERLEIISMFKATDDKDQKSKVPPEESTAKKKSSQISKSERNEIIRLLTGNYDSVSKETTTAEEEIDYNDLNKQELVELFIASGGVKEEYKHVEDPLEQRFRAAFNQYKHNKSKYAEELEKQKVENLKLKTDILDELKALIDSEETLKKTYDEFKRLQDRWKEIGMVPAGELNNLWQNYHFLVELFFDKVRINKELRDLDLKKNFERKIALCEKAEELFLEKSIIKSFKSLQQFHDDWREIGPVPSESREELWERFKAASDKINARRKEHYKELQTEQENNYEAKVVLCEKAEELIPQEELTLREWQKKTDQINDLFKVWKTVGRAPKVKNDEIWARFKTSLDSFFLTKRNFLNKLKEQQTNNLNLKIDLCVTAEAIKDSNDWKKTTNDLIRLQKEWKNIGPVPRRQSDKIWKRFRGACDEFFNRKSEFYKNIHVFEDDNLKHKQTLVKEIGAFKISKDKEANMEAFKAFQRKWLEIGHVPFKEKDKVQQDYREAIDKLIDKLDINKNELSKSGYKSKIEMFKNDPDGDWKIKKERNHLVNRINKIKEDVALWENNIGFFSSSKQSEALRKEFENKIEKAKKEIQSFEAKIKILNES